MTRPFFNLFQSHTDLSHLVWKKHLKKGFIAIDATCGNGNDSLFIAKEILEEDLGALYCIDIQKTAMKNTKELLSKNLPSSHFSRVKFYHQSHANFPSEISFSDLIVYNLGYLPASSNKELTTMVESTIESIKKACDLLSDGGLISIMCYPGHSEGLKEQTALINHLNTLDSNCYLVSHVETINRVKAPSLILIQKKLK
jgi:tRNA1(Val) A37 N6-methylase TrmN6